MGKRLGRIILLGVLLLTGCISANGMENQVAGSVQSNIENKGSDTMVNLALAWAERYQGEHSEVAISVTGGGTGTGIAALINNTVDIANASRQIKPEEVESASANGQEPMEFVVARDAIAVIVNPANPIDRLTLAQVSDIYSGKINNWAEVGGEDRIIVRVSRETNSGTHVYFLEQVVRLGDNDSDTLFALDTLLLPSSQGITAEVGYNIHAIGYDGLGYITSEVKVLAIASQPDGEYILPTTDTVNQGMYPIARDLYMYTAGRPEGETKKYLDWIFSVEAQEIVRELGFITIQAP